MKYRIYKKYNKRSIELLTNIIKFFNENEKKYFEDDDLLINLYYIYEFNFIINNFNGKYCNGRHHLSSILTKSRKKYKNIPDSLSIDNLLDINFIIDFIMKKYTFNLSKDELEKSL